MLTKWFVVFVVFLMVTVKQYVLLFWHKAKKLMKLKLQVLISLELKTLLTLF